MESDDLKTSLESLSTIGHVDVQRSDTDENGGHTWSITFQTELGDLPALEVDTLALTGSLPYSEVREPVVGVSPPFNSGTGGLSLGSTTITNLDSLEHVISDIRQGVVYTARVAATNAVGFGPAVIVAPPFIVPLPQVPTEPTDATLTVRDGSTIELSVGEPIQNGGEVVDLYQVEWASAPIVDEVQSVRLTSPSRPEIQSIATSAPAVSEEQIVYTTGSGTVGVFVDEVQTIECDANGGSFTITVDGETTDPIMWDASASEVQAALMALTNVNGVSVAISSDTGVAQANACRSYDNAGTATLADDVPPEKLVLTFDATNGVAGYHGDVPEVTTFAELLHGAKRATVATQTPGSAPLDGTFAISFADSPSVDVAHDASDAQFVLALESLTTIAAGTVAVTRSVVDTAGGYVWTVTFNFDADVPALVVDDANLRGNDRAVYVCTDGVTSSDGCGTHGASSVAGNQIAGSFTLTLRGHTTEAIPYNAAATTLKARLEALDNIGTVDVERGSPTTQRGYVWSVTFLSNPGQFPASSGDMALMVGDGARLTGFDSDVVVSPVQDGATPLGGTFTLTFGGALTTGPLRHDSTSMDVKAALEALPDIGSVQVDRLVQTDGYLWSVTFDGCRVVDGADVCTRGDVDELVPDASLLVGGYAANVPTVVVQETTKGTGGSIGVDRYNTDTITDLSGGAPYTYAMTNLVAGTPYYVRVSAHSAVGFGDRAFARPEALAPANQVPMAPYAPVRVASTSTSITLAWEHPLETGGTPVTGYELHMDTWAGGEWRRVYDGTDMPHATRFTLHRPQVMPGRRYRFAVSALNAIGTSPRSLESTFDVIDANAPDAPAAPIRDPVTGMGGPSNGDAVVAFRWAVPADNKGAPVTSYEVYIDDGQGGAFTPETPAPRFGGLEVQVLRTDATNGTLRFVVEGDTGTVAVDFHDGVPAADAVLAAVESVNPALLGLVGVTTEADSDVAFSRYAITFYTATGDLPELAVDTTSLVHTTTEVTTRANGYGQASIQKITTGCSITPCTLGGEYTLSMVLPDETITSEGIAPDATAAEVKAAFTAPLAASAVAERALEVLRRTVDETNGLYEYYIVFTDNWLDAGANAPLLQPRIEDMTIDNLGYPSVVPTVHRYGELRHVARGRQEGRAYRAFVRAINAVGRSPDSAMVSILSAQVAAPPPSPTIVDVQSTAISLAWSAGADTGGTPITGYKVYMFPGVAPGSLADPEPVKREVQTIRTSSDGPVAEVQEVTTTNSTTGTFTLRVGQEPFVTAPLDHDASEDDVETALMALESVTGVVTVTRGALVDRGYTWSITFAEHPGDLPLLFADASSLRGSDGGNSLVPTATVTETVQGSPVLSGDFTVSFRGEITDAIPHDISAADMERRLENLPTVGEVSVVRTDEPNGGYSWAVEFLSDVGLLPSMEVTRGRLNGTNADVTVIRSVPGSPSVLVFDGTGLPSIKEHVVTGLNLGTTYAFKVAALTAVGHGEPSTATDTVVARAGASPSHTTAAGSALRTGITGVVFEEQHVSASAAAAIGGSFMLRVGNDGDWTEAIWHNASAADVQAALTGLSFASGTDSLGVVHVTTLDDVVNTTRVGAAWAVTFVSNEGDVPPLQVDQSMLTGAGSPSVSVVEFVRGQANTFTIEPRKASGDVLKDLTAARGLEGRDAFFTEMWTTPTSVVDGTHEWAYDGGVATYNPVTYDIQVIETHITPAGTLSGDFTLRLDTSAWLGGSVETTGSIAHDASPADMQAALQLLPNAGDVFVTRSAIGASASEEAYAWTVTFTSLLGDVPTLTPVDVANLAGGTGWVVTYEQQAGVTEIQTITTSAFSSFRREVQTITTSSPDAGPVLSGEFTITLGDAAPVTVQHDVSAENLKIALEGIDGVNEVLVDRVDNPDTATNSFIWTVQFFDPVGDVENMVVDDTNLLSTGPSPAQAAVNEEVQGESPLGGFFLVEYRGSWTDNIRYDATAAEMKAHLEAMDTIGTVNVERLDNGNGHEWLVTFLSNLGDLPSMTAHPVVHEMQRVATSGGMPTPLEGDFRLSFGGETTMPISFSASPESMKAALEALPTIGVVEVRRTGPFGQGQYIWDVTFRTDPGDLPDMGTDGSGLRGTDAAVAVSEIQPGNTAALTGDHPEVWVEGLVAGLPSYTGRYEPDAVGDYTLAVLQLQPGGLRADYFDNQWLQDAPTLSRVDATLNFNWGTGMITPHGRDFVSARWWGKVRPTTSETYTFYLTADDGARLWIDHKLVIDRWDGTFANTETRAEVDLTEGAFHDVKVEYREVRGHAAIRLQWSSQSVLREVVPSHLLFSPSHIGGSPFAMSVVPGRADYPHTTAAGAGLEGAVAGEPTEFIIQAKDERGNNRTLGGEEFQVTLQGPGAVSLDFTPEYIGGGQYRVPYTATVAGEYTVSVTIADTHIYCGLGAANKCSPFSITVQPGKADFLTTDAQGSGLLNSTAGEVTEFTIYAIDAYGNALWEGGDEFNITLSLVGDQSQWLSEDDSGVYAALVEDLNDGTYRVTYNAFIAGVYEVTAMLGSDRINNLGVRDKATPLVVHNNLHGPSTTATGVGLASTTANDVATFLVHARDAFGNYRTGLGSGDGRSDVFEARLTGPSGQVVRTTSAVVTLSVVADEGSFSITYAGATTPDLPFDCDPAALELALELLLRDPFMEQGPLELQPRDGRLVAVYADSDAATDADPVNGHAWRVEILSATALASWSPSQFVANKASLAVAGNGAAASVDVDPLAEAGTYPMQYVLHEAGDWRLDVTNMRDGSAIVGSPFTVHTAVAVTHPGSSTAQGAGLFGGVAGDDFEFTVQANDARVVEVQTITTRAVEVPEVPEVQSIACVATSGAFEVLFRPSLSASGSAGATASIPFNAPLSTASTPAGDSLEELLEAMDGIDDVTITVDTGSAQSTVCDSGLGASARVYVTFGSPTVGDVPELSLGADTTDVSPTIATVTAGTTANRNEIQSIMCQDDNTGTGSFQVAFRGSTVTIPGTAAATGVGSVEDLLESNLPVGDVTVAFAAGASATTACDPSAPDALLVTFETLEGDVEDLVVTSATASVAQASEVVSGVSPLWGTFTLTFGGRTTGALATDASAAEVAAEISALPTVGDVSVTSSGYGLTRTYTVRFDGVVPPHNLGDLPLLVADASNLNYADSGQLPPAIMVREVTAGEVGNHRDEATDTELVTLKLTHRTLPDRYVSMTETQAIVCNATGGSFTLSMGDLHVSVDADDTLTQLSDKLNDAWAVQGGAGSVVVSDQGVYELSGSGQGTICSFDAQPIYISWPTVRVDVDPLLESDLDGLTSGEGVSDGAVGGTVDIYEYVKGGARVTYSGDGLYDVVYVPTLKGHWDIEVFISGVAVGTDLREGTFIHPAVSSGPHSIHTAEAIAIEDVTEPFQIQARDRFENELDNPVASDVDFIVSLAGHADARSNVDHTSVTVAGTVSDAAVPNTDGLYDVTYFPEVAGSYELSIMQRNAGGLKATYYGNRDFTAPEAGRFPHCLRTMVACDSTRLDSVVDFAWNGEPALGAPHLYPTDQFSVVWSGELRAPATGTYTFIVASDGAVKLTIGGEAVIDDGTLSASEVSGTVALTAGVAVSIKLRYQDAPLGPAFVSMYWQSDDAGIMREVVPASALLTSRHIRGSPMEVTFYPGDIDPATTTATGEGLSFGTAGVTSEFTIFSKDTHGNRRYNTGNDMYEITVYGVEGWAEMGRTNDWWDGYEHVLSTEAGSVAYTPNDWTIACASCAAVTNGSSLIRTNADLRGTVVRGARVGVGGETLFVATDGDFTNYGIPTTRPFLRQPQDQVALHVAGNETGTYRVTYTPTVRGKYHVDIKLPAQSEVQTITTSAQSMLDGTFRLGYQFDITNPIDFDADASVVQAELRALPAFSGDEINVTVALVDTEDEDVTRFDGRRWAVTFQTFDNLAGKLDLLLATWSGELVGNFSRVDIERTVEGMPRRPILGSPFLVEVQPAVTDAAVTTAHGRGLVAGTAGDVSSFIIQSKDQFGNDRLDSQPRDVYEVFAFHSSDTATTTVPGTVTYRGDGAYNVEFTPTVSGYHTVSVLLGTVQEVQTIIVDGLGAGQGGSFRLLHGLHESNPLAWDASPEDIKRAVEAFPGVGTVSVWSDLRATRRWFQVTFLDTVGDVEALHADTSSLLPRTATVDIVETTKGARAHIKTASQPLVFEEQVVRIAFDDAIGQGGTFTLSFAGETTDAIAWDAPAESDPSSVQAALSALSTVGSVRVSSVANGMDGTDYTVTFMPVLQGQSGDPIVWPTGVGSLADLSADESGLTGTNPVATVFTKGSTGSVEGASPFRAWIEPAAISGAHCTAFDEPTPAGDGGLTTGIFETDSHFHVQARDRFSNAVPRGLVNEVQVVTLAWDDAIAGGSFTLNFRGAETAPVDTRLATPELLEGVLEALPTVGAVDVELDATASGMEFTVTFRSESGDLPAMTVGAGTALNGTNPTITVTSCDHHVRQVVTTSVNAGATIGGTFTLRFGDEVTTDLPFNIDADLSTQWSRTSRPVRGMKQALEELPSVTTVEVSRGLDAGDGTTTWTITFLAWEPVEVGQLDPNGNGDGAALGLPLLYAEGQLLSGTGAAVGVAETCAASGGNAVSSVAGVHGRDFVVRLTGPSTVHGDMVYSGSAGVYDATYFTPRVGTYQLDISLADEGGLAAEYFNNRWLFGTPAAERVDPVLDFRWPGLITATGQDYVSGRWTGFVQPMFSQDYTFIVEVNDGAKVWINGEVVIDQFDATVADGAPANRFEGVAPALVAGRLYDIKVEWREQTDAASLRLMWSSASQPEEVIPPSRLFHSHTFIVDNPFTVVPVGVEATPPTGASVVVDSETSLLVSWFPPVNDGGDDVTAYKVTWWSAWGDREVQTVKLEGATGGTFTLTLGSETTLPLAFDIDHDVLAAELNKLAGINKVTVTGEQGPEWQITFATDRGNIDALVIDDTGLTGSGSEKGGVCHGASPVVLGNGISCLASDSVEGTAATNYCNSTELLCNSADSLCHDSCPLVTGADLDVVAGSPFAYTIQGLLPGVRYEIAVSAYNTQGYGMVSSPIHGATKNGIHNREAKVSLTVRWRV